MQITDNTKTKGWIFDVYPADIGEMAVWIISEKDERIRLTDKFQPKIYVSGTKEHLEQLIGRIYSNQDIAQWGFTYKIVNPTDIEKSRVLEITLKDCRKVSTLTTHVLKLGITCVMRYITATCMVTGPISLHTTYFLLPF